MHEKQMLPAQWGLSLYFNEIGIKNVQGAGVEIDVVITHLKGDVGAFGYECYTLYFGLAPDAKRKGGERGHFDALVKVDSVEDVAFLILKEGDLHVLCGIADKGGLIVAEQTAQAGEEDILVFCHLYGLNRHSRPDESTLAVPTFHHHWYFSGNAGGI